MTMVVKILFSDYLFIFYHSTFFLLPFPIDRSLWAGIDPVVFSMMRSAMSHPR